MNKIWFYAKGNVKQGPFTDEEFIKLIRAEIVEGDDLIWTMELSGWIRLKDTMYNFYIPSQETTQI